MSEQPPSPEGLSMDQSRSLDDLVITHPEFTYLCRAQGQSMINSGIHDGDVLVINRALTPQHRDISVVAVNGELTVKYLDLKNQQLVSANPKLYPPIPISEGSECITEGVVTASIRFHKPPNF